MPYRNYPNMFIAAVKKEFPRFCPGGGPNNDAILIHTLVEQGKWSLGVHLKKHARCAVSNAQEIDLIRGRRIDTLLHLKYEAVRRELLLKTWEDIRRAAEREELFSTPANVVSRDTGLAS